MEQHQINLSVGQTTPVSCDKCSNTFFQEALHIRKASGFLTGTGQPTYMPIPVFVCTECKHVNTEFLPREIQNLDKEG